MKDYKYMLITTALMAILGGVFFINGISAIVAVGVSALWIIFLAARDNFIRKNLTRYGWFMLLSMAAVIVAYVLPGLTILTIIGMCLMVFTIITHFKPEREYKLYWMGVVQFVLLSLAIFLTVNLNIQLPVILIVAVVTLLASSLTRATCFFFFFNLRTGQINYLKKIKEIYDCDFNMEEALRKEEEYSGVNNYGGAVLFKEPGSSIIMILGFTLFALSLMAFQYSYPQWLNISFLILTVCFITILILQVIVFFTAGARNLSIRLTEDILQVSIIKEISYICYALDLPIELAQSMPREHMQYKMSLLNLSRVCSPYMGRIIPLLSAKQCHYLISISDVTQKSVIISSLSAAQRNRILGVGRDSEVFYDNRGVDLEAKLRIEHGEKRNLGIIRRLVPGFAGAPLSAPDELDHCNWRVVLDPLPDPNTDHELLVTFANIDPIYKRVIIGMRALRAILSSTTSADKVALQAQFDSAKTWEDFVVFFNSLSLEQYKNILLAVAPSARRTSLAAIDSVVSCLNWQKREGFKTVKRAVKQHFSNGINNRPVRVAPNVASEVKAIPLPNIVPDEDEGDENKVVPFSPTTLEAKNATSFWEEQRRSNAAPDASNTVHVSFH